MAGEIETIDQTPPEKTGPTPEELEEQKFRERLKEKYGIEDPPDEFRKKRTMEQQAFENLPKYHQALTFAHQMLTGQVRKEDSPPRGPVTDERAEDERLRDLAMRDPYAAMREREKVQEERLKLILATHAQGVDKLVQERVRSQEAASNALSRLQDEWPEVYDPNHELFLEGNRVFWGEFEEWERRRPNAALRAAEIAAGRLGLPPRSRRQPPVTEDRDVSSQSVGSTSRRPRQETSDIKVSEKEKTMIEEMGLDTDIFKKARQARRDKKNLRVE